MINRDNRTFICSVVYYDIADYSTKSVAVQIRLKEQLMRLTADAVQNVAVNDRILLETGDGAAICFLGDPEDALFVAMNLRDALWNAADQFKEDPLLMVRFGINLGPVKMVTDVDNKKNIIGDGVNVAQRVMIFAEPGQILVSRSYYEVVSCLNEEFAKLFQYLGMRSDNHVRNHEIYSILRTPGQDKSLPPDNSHRQGNAQIQVQNLLTVIEMRASPAGAAPARELNTTNGFLSSLYPSFLLPFQLKNKTVVYGLAAALVVLAVILSLTLNRNSGHTQSHTAQTVVSPAESVPEKPLSAENAEIKQTEPVQPPPPALSAILPPEIPGESPLDSVQTTEPADNEKKAPPKPAPAISTATFQFAVTPWGEIYVDGKRKGASPPLSSISVSPGKHRIEIKNATFRPYSHSHDIRPNEKLKISHKFQ